RTVGLGRAGVRTARAPLRAGRARGRRRLAGIVEPPAGDGAVSLEPAGMEPPCAHLSERARRWCGLAVVVAPPAGDGAVCLQPAGVVAPRADVGERARGWRRLAGGVVPPAGDGTVGLDRAGVAHSHPHVVLV